MLEYCESNGIVAWDGLDPQHVRSFAAQCHRRGLGPRSVQRRLSAARSLFRYLMREGELTRDPAADVQAPKARKRLPVTLDADAMARLLEFRADGGLGLRDKAIMELFYRVELLGVIEDELGVYLDDDALLPDAAVADVAAIVEAARGVKRKPMRWSWPLSPAVRAVGLAFQLLLMYPFVALFYRVRTTGMEALHGLDGPVLITPNHCLHLDNAIILSRLPLSVRWKLSVAAGAETIYGNPFRGILASVLANAFPLSREGSVRRSLELLGSRLDRGYNILLYPKGADARRAAAGVQGGRGPDRGGGRDPDRPRQAADQPHVDHRPAPADRPVPG